MWQKKPKEGVRSKVRLLLAAVLVAGAFLIFAQRQALADHISVWRYDPSAEIASLASRSQMSDMGRFYFYASQPRLLEASRFNSVCADHDPEGATLGCYRNRIIYIFDINDPRLDGIKEVTAAHEMLHAAYARLGKNEQQEINDLVEEAYSQLADDKLENRLKLYDKSQPGTRHIELHAILGTEYRDLSPALENHYREFFSDRLATVSLYESYIEQFTAREERAAVISEQLGRLTVSIENDSAAYSRDVQALSRAIADFNSRASNVVSLSERNALISERESLVSRTAQLERRRQAIDSMIAEYNQLVEEYNNIATEVKELNKSIDSNLDPAPSI